MIKYCGNKPDARCIDCKNLKDCKICEDWLLEICAPAKNLLTNKKQYDSFIKNGDLENEKFKNQKYKQLEPADDRIPRFLSSIRYQDCERREPSITHAFCISKGDICK